ncbi:MAG: hypothetical protein Q7S45_00665 [Candidatus Curtissbacteria bacterium]|nr:hypothetical protein [Candidatus Curtissbacteria bacterium]
MNDSLYTIIGFATIALIVFGSAKGFLFTKRKFGLKMAILVSILLLALAIAISSLTTIFRLCSPC